jgi:hypothetical protein
MVAYTRVQCIDLAADSTVQLATPLWSDSDHDLPIDPLRSSGKFRQINRKLTHEYGYNGR